MKIKIKNIDIIGYVGFFGMGLVLSETHLFFMDFPILETILIHLPRPNPFVFEFFFWVDPTHVHP